MSRCNRPNLILFRSAVNWPLMHARCVRGTLLSYNHGFFPRGSNDQCFYRSDNIPLDCFKITTFRYPGAFCVSTLKSKRIHARYLAVALTEAWLFCLCIGGWHFSGGWMFSNKRATIVGDFNGDGKDDYINLNGGRYNHQFFSL